MFGLSIAPAVWLVGLVAVLTGGWFIWDEIGDRREAKVHARYAAAAEATNVDVRAFNSEEERVAHIAEAIRQKALAATREVAGTSCSASPEQAAALSQIR